MFAASNFVEALFVCFIVLPVAMLWAAAIVDVIRAHRSGWTLAGWLLVICILPILGALLYFAMRPTPVGDRDAEAQAAYMAHADIERERAGHPVGGTGVYR